MLVSDVLLLVRYATNDMNDNAYTYYVKMNAINAANRFVRKLALDYKPSILNYTETQNTVIGTAEYTLTHKPNKINSVRLAGELIPKLDHDCIIDLTQTGTPQGYYMSAFDKISFWPVPDAVKAFSVYMVEGSSDLADSDTLPWTSDLADAIVAYAVGLLIGTLDAVGMKAEVRKLLNGLEPDAVGVSSYWAIKRESDY